MRPVYVCNCTMYNRTQLIPLQDIFVFAYSWQLVSKGFNFRRMHAYEIITFQGVLLNDSVIMIAHATEKPRNVLLLLFDRISHFTFRTFLIRLIYKVNIHVKLNIILRCKSLCTDSGDAFHFSTFCKLAPFCSIFSVYRSVFFSS